MEPNTPQNIQPAPRKKGLAITSLVIGACSILAVISGPFNFITGILGIVFGAVALKKHQPKPLAITGLILGAVGLIASVLVTVFVYVPIATEVFNKAAESAQIEKEEANGIKSDKPLLVGTDIPAGEYRIIRDKNPLYEQAQIMTTVTVGKALDDRGRVATNDGTRFDYDNLSFYSLILTLEEGQYIDTVAGLLYPIDQSPKISIDDQKKGTEIMFLVGTDIPAGTYKPIEVREEGVSGQYEILSSSKPSEIYLQRLEDLGKERPGLVRFETPRYDDYAPFEVKDGQYLKLSALYIERVEN